MREKQTKTTYEGIHLDKETKGPKNYFLPRTMMIVSTTPPTSSIKQKTKKIGHSI